MRALSELKDSLLFFVNKFYYCNLLIIKRKYLSLARLWEIVSLKITKNIEGNMIKSVKIAILVLLFTVMQSGLAYAQPTRINAQEYHAMTQQNMIAYNKFLPKIMNVVDSTLILSQFVSEGDDLDAMLEDGWDEQWLETFSTKNPKDTLAIDVKDHCIPVPGRVTSAYG